MPVPSSTRACPKCDSAVAPDARFCANCGQSLAPPEADDAERHQRLTAAAPAPLIEKMRAARLTGERKPVTALFADVVGSTAMAERMDPEDWTSMMNQAFDLMSRAVFRYEGTIAQLQGDAMVAFFGAPVAHEDDPERAVLAALDMIEATQEFARELRQEHGIDFRIRAGINTGPVIVGNVGSDLRYEYTALGDAMNTAARMQAAAEPGTVIVTDATLRLAPEAFDAADLGEIEVKGKTDRVHAHRIVGRRVTPGRRRGLERMGLDSPMVGRAAPLAILTGLLDVARAGRGRIAFVIGEPGIGKSRLLAELRRAATVGGATVTAGADGKAAGAAAASAAGWVEGRCVSYGRNLPYHLLIDLVRSALDVPFVASEADSRAALDRKLGELLGEDAPDAAPYLAHLLTLPLRPDEAARAKIPPEVLQARYIAATHRVLRALASRGPLVVVAEDLHWADPASVSVVQQLLPLASQLPILFIGAMRAETDSAGWALLGAAREAFGAAMSEIRLEPLDAAQSRELVSNLLEIESLPAAIRDLILARAEGNPFFVEEVVRMLVDGGVIVAQGNRWVATEAVSTIAIPETLHGLLLARIDQLPDDAKRSLRVAAVIGRQFPVRVLVEVLDSQLGTIAR